MIQCMGVIHDLVPLCDRIKTYVTIHLAFNAYSHKPHPLVRFDESDIVHLEKNLRFPKSQNSERSSQESCRDNILLFLDTKTWTVRVTKDESTSFIPVGCWRITYQFIACLEGIPTSSKGLPVLLCSFCYYCDWR